MPPLRAGVWGLLGKGDASMVGFDHQGRGGGGLLQKVPIIKFGILKWRRKSRILGPSAGWEAVTGAPIIWYRWNRIFVRIAIKRAAGRGSTP